MATRPERSPLQEATVKIRLFIITGAPYAIGCASAGKPGFTPTPGAQWPDDAPAFGAPAIIPKRARASPIRHDPTGPACRPRR